MSIFQLPDNITHFENVFGRKAPEKNMAKFIKTILPFPMNGYESIEVTNPKPNKPDDICCVVEAKIKTKTGIVRAVEIFLSFDETTLVPIIGHIKKRQLECAKSNGKSEDPVIAIIMYFEGTGSVARFVMKHPFTGKEDGFEIISIDSTCPPYRSNKRLN